MISLAGAAGFCDAYVFDDPDDDPEGEYTDACRTCRQAPSPRPSSSPPCSHTRFISGNQDGTIRLWDLEGEPVQRRYECHPDSVGVLRITADRYAFFTGVCRGAGL